MAEISLAGARKIKLQTLANDGNQKAQDVLDLQASPGKFITVVQIGLNMVAILAGVIGESAFAPIFDQYLRNNISNEIDPSIASWISFFLVTTCFILLADLIPKRIAMTYPEESSMRIVRIMKASIFILSPLVWIFDFLANSILKLLKISTLRKENITSEDIVALVGEGAESGVLKEQEHYLIENIFEMQERTVTSSMTARESIVFLDVNFTREQVIDTIQQLPHPKMPICNGSVDKILGYVDTHNLLTQYLQSEQTSLTDPRVLRKMLYIPDTLSLFEILELFKSAGEDFAVIVNEYALVVGIITLKDVMNIVMGELVSTEEDQIVRRDENSWLIDGATPLEYVMRVLNIDDFPNSENYETIAGFMMYSLRKIPKKTDFVIYGGYKFEIIDTDNFKIDQLLVSKYPTHE